jgi:hypothetical protein
MMTGLLLKVLQALHRPDRRRDEAGGVSDETAMIGLMLGVAVAVSAIIYALATGAASNLDFGF